MYIYIITDYKISPSGNKDFVVTRVQLFNYWSKIVCPFCLSYDALNVLCTLYDINVLVESKLYF